MESMSTKFRLIVASICLTGEITILEDTKKDYIFDRKPILRWMFTIPDNVRYFEDKKNDSQAIIVGDKVYLLEIVTIKRSTFVVASKRDKRSLKGYKEVKLPKDGEY